MTEIDGPPPGGAGGGQTGVGPERAAGDPPEPGPDAGDGRRVTRRDLVHELADRTLPVAGGLLSTSGALTRALRAAGDALTAGLDGLSGVGDPGDAGHAQAPGEQDLDHAPLAEHHALWPATVPDAPSIPPPPTPVIAPEVAAVLCSATAAVIGVSGSDGHPHLVSLRFAWDGEVLRVLSLAWSAVARGVRQDPRVSACLIDLESGRFATVMGEARIIDGDGVREEARPVLARYHPPGSIEEAWRAMEAEGDRIVIRIHPVRAFSGAS